MMIPTIRHGASPNLEKGARLMNRIHISKLIAAVATLFIAVGLQIPAQSTGFPTTLSVNSWPTGITVTSPNCFTVTSGTCGVTGWVSTNVEGIPTTTYTFPLTATIDGNDYQLSINSITGCNGNSGTSLPGQCTVQVAAGSIASIFATYKVLPSPPIPPCVLVAQNLVPNHGFESTLTAGVSTGSNSYWIIGVQNQSKVLHWTADTTTTQSVFMSGSVGGNQITAYEGNKFAVINSFGGLTNAGIRSEITPAPTQGASYVVTARVRALPAPHSDFISIHFLNSGTQVQSAKLVRTVTATNKDWELVGGVIVANSYFNRMVIRMWGEAPFAAIDDVKVCKMATSNKKILISPTPTPTKSASAASGATGPMSPSGPIKP